MSVNTFCFGSGKSNLYKRKKRTTTDLVDYEIIEDMEFENELVFNYIPVELNNNLDIDEVENLVVENHLDNFEILESVPEIQIDLENVDFNHIQFNNYLHGSIIIQGIENNVIKIFKYIIF